MSNFRAISAVTATLLYTIHQACSDLEIDDFDVISVPPSDLDQKDNFINLFLYMVRENPTGRNMDLPARDYEGSRVSVYPLVLDLYFILSAYSKTDSRSELLLGAAVQSLHEHPVLNRAEIAAAIEDATVLKDVDVDLANQLEQVKITPKSLNSDELSKLWSAFQAPFRTSAAYKVSVVIIESDEGKKAALPVLSLGPTADPSLLPPLPTLTELSPPNQQTAVRVGETLTLKGAHLDGTSVAVHFRHRLLAGPIDVALADNDNPGELSVSIDPGEDWAAGNYGVTVTLLREGETEERSTNELPLVLAPTVAIDNGNITNVGGTVTIDEVECTPTPLDQQAFSLFVGSKELSGTILPGPDSHLRFTSSDLAPGDYWYRLRIDGVDSLLVLRPEEGDPQFDPSQKLTVGQPT